MNRNHNELVLKTLGWVLGTFSALMGIVMIVKGALFLGLVSLAQAIAFLPVFDIPIVIRFVVLLIAFVIL